MPWLSAVAVSKVESITIETIRRRFTTDDEETPYQEFLRHDALLSRGVEIAENLGLIVIVRDEFGPDIIKRASDFWGAWREVVENEYAPFSKYALAGDDGYNWLRRALASVNENFDRLNIQEGDFVKTDDEWTPIPLDRADQKLQEATEALEATIEELRKDNGYGATYPEEKTYVLEKLESAHKRLKEDAQISWMYLKNFAFEPLGRIAKRFGQAAIGLIAASAKEALKSWLKSKGVNFLDDVF